MKIRKIPKVLNVYRSKRFRCSCCVMMIFVLLLCSCQKKPQIAIQIGGTSSPSSTSDLKVVDGNYQEVLNRCQEKLLEVEKGSLEEADINNIIGGIYAEYLLDQENALLYLNKAIDIHQSKEDYIGLAKDYAAISHIYIVIGGDADIGFDYLEKAEQLYLKYGMENTFSLASVLIDKGHLYLKEGQYEEALEVLEKAQEIYDKKLDSSITIFLLRGQAYLEKMEYVLAEEQYLKALEICQNENDEYNISRIMSQLGWLYASMEKHDKAIDCYNQSLSIAQSFNVFLSNSATTYNNVAYSYDQLQETEKTLESSIKACQLIEGEEPVTSETIESLEIFKHNLSRYWYDRYNSLSQDKFDKWYQETVIEEKDWRESDMEKEKIQAD